MSDGIIHEQIANDPKILSLGNARAEIAAAKAGIGSLYEPPTRGEVIERMTRLVDAVGKAIGDATGNVGQVIYDQITSELGENMERMEVFVANRVIEHLRKHGALMPGVEVPDIELELVQEAEASTEPPK